MHFSERDHLPLASNSDCALLLPSLIVGFTPDVKIWEVTFAQDAHFKQVNHVMDLKGHNAGVQGVTFSGDGKSAASVSRDGTWKMWSIDGGWCGCMCVCMHVNE